MSLSFKILGCGNSFGVPRPGNDWGSCDPANPKNRRTRCSLLVRSHSTTIIVDTGQDFRDQMNRNEIERLDAVLYSHAHGDHVSGIDDLRCYAQRQKQLMPIYSSQNCIEDLNKRFPYMFGSSFDIYPPVLKAHVIEPYKSYLVGDIAFTPHVLDHGTLNAYGYRFGDIAYSVDMFRLFDDQSYEALKGIKTWVVDAGSFNYTESPVHASLDSIFEMNERVQARRVILSVLSHRIDYGAESIKLPPQFELAYDGMEL